MRPTSLTSLISIPLLGLALIPGPATAAEGVVPTPGMVITQDTSFAPGTYEFPDGDGIVIAADGITVDGNGATLVGPGVAGDPDTYAGTAVTADGHSGVTLTGLTARGFDLGLKVSDGSGWTITTNDFSGNYDNPSVAWTDGPLAGAILLENVSESRVENNTAHNNWNGLTLRHSNDNTIADNDISHCSNVCLKMWRASRNMISDNNFSYGIRQQNDQCQTHACDSTSALIETGSNDNEFYRNDFTHGGDGVFIRPLNGVVSTGNYFEENDGSYANNNAWESWSPGNTYVRNKGNHSSYGFWLGGSDHTVMIGNEAAYNGVTKANAPEDFGNAGVSVVNGSSSHFVFVGNHVHDNKSPGVAIRYQAEYPAYHWVIQQNRITDNATYGIYLRNAKWLDIAGNEISGNPGGAIKRDGALTDVFERSASMDDEAPTARASISPMRGAVAGEPVTFDASESTDPSGAQLAYRWDLGDGTIADTAQTTHTFDEAGFYRVGVTVNNGKLADIKGFDFYVTDPDPEAATDAAAEWNAQGSGGEVAVSGDDAKVVKGERSIRLDGDATAATLRYTGALDLADVSTLAFWISAEHEERAFGTGQPVIRLLAGDGDYIEYTPSGNWLDPWAVPYQEARYGWQRVEIPLAGGGSWARTVVGDASLDDVTGLEVSVTSGGGAYTFWLDGMVTYNVPDVAPSIAYNPTGVREPMPITSSGDTPWSLVDGASEEVAWSSGDANAWVGVNFDALREFNQVVLRSSADGDPASVSVEYRRGDTWRDVEKADTAPAAAGATVVTFDTVLADAVRVHVTPPQDREVTLTELEVRHTGNVAGNRQAGTPVPRTPSAAASSESGAALKAIDGSLDTSWVPAHGDRAQWISVNFGIRRTVNKVNLHLNEAPAGIQLQYWGSGGWADVTHLRTTPGEVLRGTNILSFDNVSTRRLRVLVDGAAKVQEFEATNANLVLNALGRGRSITPEASYTSPYDTLQGPIDGTYGASPRWTSWNSHNDSDWYALTFDGPTVIGRVNLHVYNDNGGVIPPEEYRIQYWKDGRWADVTEITRDPAEPGAGYNTVVFEPVTTTKIRFFGVNVNPENFGQYVGLTEFEPLRWDRI
ncbi:discoidin domain-containing protein [Actinopolymorpha sp. B11F2]|uniref:galactose-binding domain-containing protein n=1 Tax=Actinopolymorpha sp. B11F2 TaxID=3160862 RepID=UPI0032E446DB